MNYLLRKINTRKFLIGKPDANTPLGESRYSWNSNVQMDLEENGM
jgi:hypothetical protein